MNIRNLSWKPVMKSASLIGLVSIVVFSFLSVDTGGVKKNLRADGCFEPG